MSSRNVSVLSITSFVIDVAFSSWWMILPLYLERLGASVSEVGMSFSLINVAWALSQLPGGLLSDRFGRKIIILLSTSTFIPFFISMLLLKDWLTVALAVAISSFFAGLQNPSFSSMIAESSEKLGVARAFGFYNFLLNLGWAVGPLLGSFIIPSYGFDPLFILGIVASLSCLAIRATLLREPPKLEGTSSFGVTFIPLLISLSIFNLANGLISPLIPIYAEKSMNFSIEEIEYMFFVAQLLTSISSIAAGSLVMKIGGLRGLTLSFVFSGVFSLLWVFSRTYAAFIFISLYYIALFSLAEVSFGTSISEITARDRRATAFGTATVITGLSHSVGSYLGGILWEISKPEVPFFLASSIMLLSSLPLRAVRSNATPPLRYTTSPSSLP